MTEEQIREIIRDELSNHLALDRYIFDKLVQFMDGRNIQFGKTKGTKLGTATDQKMSVYGETPVIQGSTISDPSGGGTIDAEARVAINNLIDRLQDFGIIA